MALRASLLLKPECFSLKSESPEEGPRTWAIATIKITRRKTILYKANVLLKTKHRRCRKYNRRQATVCTTTAVNRTRPSEISDIGVLGFATARVYCATFLEAEYVPAFRMKKTENKTVARSLGLWKTSSSYSKLLVQSK